MKTYDLINQHKIEQTHINYGYCKDEDIFIGWNDKKTEWYLLDVSPLEDYKIISYFDKKPNITFKYMDNDMNPIVEELIALKENNKRIDIENRILISRFCRLILNDSFTKNGWKLSSKNKMKMRKLFPEEFVKEEA